MRPCQDAFEGRLEEKKILNLDMLPILSSKAIREVPPLIEPPCRVLPDLCWSWHVFFLQPDVVRGFPNNLPGVADAQPETAGDGGK